MSNEVETVLQQVTLVGSRLCLTRFYFPFTIRLQRRETFHIKQRDPRRQSYYVRCSSTTLVVKLHPHPGPD